MVQPIISIDGIGKRYRLGSMQSIFSYKTFRDLLTNIAKTPLRLGSGGKGDGNSNSEESEFFWALKDISFEVEPGEIIGIVGRNGAGKTTLLKILSQITEPTEGEIRIRGRVASLLEVGTGFHPELTGRENTFMNGAIMGMSRGETIRKFDEIVAFAEVEKFIDTPVKRYSSGMYVRLAFAVAAHLEPEILLVDEVLAVGDAAFQKKCLGKMGDVAKEGRTILFVSHNMVAVQSLCERVIWLNDGQIVEEGLPGEVVSNYLKSSSSTLTEQVWDDPSTAPGNDLVRIHRVCVRTENGSPSDPITMETSFLIEVEFWNLAPDAHLVVTLHIYTEQGIIAFSSGTLHEPVWHDRPFPMGLFRSACRIPGNLLNNGIHRVLLLIVKDQRHVLYKHEDILSFEVLDSVQRRGTYFGKRVGVVSPLLDWSTEYLGNPFK